MIDQVSSACNQPLCIPDGEYQLNLARKLPQSIFAVRKLRNAALVKRLRRLPFTEESRVRVPYVVLKACSKERAFNLKDGLKVKAIGISMYKDVRLNILLVASVGILLHSTPQLYNSTCLCSITPPALSGARLHALLPANPGWLV